MTETPHITDHGHSGGPDDDEAVSVLDTLADDRIALLNDRVSTLERTNRENDRLIADLLAQANADFEERTWLRRLFDDVQHFDDDTALVAVKFNLLAPLRHLLGARCVRLLPVAAPGGVELPHVVVGESPLTADVCGRFAQDVLDVTASTRFLFNRGPHAMHEHLVPEPVQNALVMGIELNGHLRGWLVAIDKLVPLVDPHTFTDGTSEREFGTVEYSLAECAASSLAARLRLLEVGDLI